MDLNAYALEKWVEYRLADARQDAAVRNVLGSDLEEGIASRWWRALMRAARTVWAGSGPAGARRRSSSATHA